MPKYKTKQRTAIWTFLSEHYHEPLTARQILDGLNSRNNNISLSTLYRNLSELEQEGKMRRTTNKSSSEALYQLKDLHECSGKIHLSCNECGTLFHMHQNSIDALKKQLNESDEFEVDPIETVIHGICGHCKKSGKRPSPRRQK